MSQQDKVLGIARSDRYRVSIRGPPASVMNGRHALSGRLEAVRDLGLHLYIYGPLIRICVGKGNTPVIRIALMVSLW